MGMGLMVSAIAAKTLANQARPARCSAPDARSIRAEVLRNELSSRT